MTSSRVASRRIKDSQPDFPERLIKIGAKVISHGPYVTFQMAEVAVPQKMFQEILSLIAPGAARAGVRGAGSDDATDDDGRGAP